MPRIPFVKIWLGVSALASVAGWGLSAVGQLNRAGYAVLMGAAVVVFLAGRMGLGWRLEKSRGRAWKKFRRRFSRWLPASFAILAGLAFLGGALYPPTNHTGLSYRIPRVLQWLSHGQWVWIHTANYRMNNRACGIEWLTAPVLLFTRSDRGLFLINFIPFLLLPGLIFGVCRQLGVKGRGAWQWMWLLPTGYCFLLQSASAGNDAFPTVYGLAALDFGCRAWKSRRPSDLWFSLLAAALLTGAKASNLPLLLPWVILVFPLLILLRQRRLATSCAVVVAAVVSFLPSAVLNARYCGDWTGLKLERAGMDMKNPVVGIWGNTFLLLLNNFAPPIFPQAGWWNQSALTILPRALVAPLVENFEQGFLQLGELPTEDWAGVGFGVSVLLAVSVVGAIRLRGVQKAGVTKNPRNIRRKATPLPVRSSRGEGEDLTAASRSAQPAALYVTSGQEVSAKLRRWVLVAPWLALGAYCAKSGMVTGARLITPYYPLLLPSLLVMAGQEEVVRRRWWRVLVAVVLVLALLVVVLSPPRPLWPARTLIAKALELRPNQALLVRARNVYEVYAQRSDPLAGLRALLPQGLETVGFMGTPDDIDISLWRPYGSRRVEHILPADSAAEIRGRGIRWAVVGGLNLEQNGTTLAAWLDRSGVELMATTNVTVKVAEGPQSWSVVRFKER